MNRSLHTALIISALISLSFQSILYAGRLELKFFSSETGYSITPDKLLVSDANNPANSFSIQKNSANSYITELARGSYFITAFHSGFASSQTNFTISDNEIRYDIFMDPLTVNSKLNVQRIKSLMKPDAALLLGYVVDDATGEPLSNVSLYNSSSPLTQTDAEGYFQVYVPANCDSRTMLDLKFGKEPYNSELYNSFEVTPSTDFIFTVRMKKGQLNTSAKYVPISEKCSDCTPQTMFPNMAVTGFVVPLNIRVGKNCTGTNCSYAQVYSLQTYCKYVLPAEIYACWGNLTGGMNSLQACAVAVRSYGMYYVYNPINAGLYDICDNTYCQYMGTTLSTNTSNAVDNTFGYILTNSSGVVRSEYSAENNNKGCGNGYSGTGTSWPCISDPVCTGFSPNGHGRGLCQWGTVRWATGRVVSTSSPCSQGTAHSYGTKTWQGILAHYYTVSPQNWQITQGTSAVINSSVSSPTAANPCAQVTINSNVTTIGTGSLMIGASIAPTGTENWISDPTNDIERTFTSGTANYSRVFKIPCNTASGTYDLYTALWYDKNNNNTIDGSDFVVSTKITSAAITISPIGINIISTEIPDKFALLPNYPNPFNPVTKIKFDIPNPAYTKIIIYDLSGRVVANLVNEQLKPGSYSVDWNGTGFASGVYFYSLVTDEYTETKRMVLIK
ncbi:MAG: T9SS type A sorting domain-containing protein [Ignavibacteria bacterium]|nr:T9SS type A sorting domain-containing protein [Ignavibacteria bacterium]